MAKAKQATQAAPAPATDTKADAQATAAKLAAMLNESAREARGDADVDANVPQKKIAGGRATWKGVMTLPNGAGGKLAQFAVKACTAVDDEKFERHMYHSAECKSSVKYGEMSCSGCGATGLTRYNTVKGVDHNGEVILISDEELAALIPQNEKNMRITEYVDGVNIDPIYFEETEYLYPEDDKKGAAAVTFAVLGAMLRRTGKVAKGIRVKRGKEQYFIVRPYGNNGLTLNILRAEYEVRDASSLWTPVEVSSEMVEMFAQVAEADTKAFTPAKRDQYLANANKLVADKAAGVKTDCPTPEPEQKGTDDLLAALRATLQANAAKAGK